MAIMSIFCYDADDDTAILIVMTLMMMITHEELCKGKQRCPSPSLRTYHHNITMSKINDSVP